jgi:protein-S-isoprenylcysteine O-methyltransferase Ste14
MAIGSKDTPRVVAPPPLIFLAFVIAGFLLYWLRPLPFAVGIGYDILGVLLIVVPIAIAIWARNLFIRAGTNVEPYKPTTVIVDKGPFAYSRNPLYICLFALYFGIALVIGNGWLLPLAVPLFFIMLYGVILREERYLEAKFGESYLSYKRRVRRWL